MTNQTNNLIEESEWLDDLAAYSEGALTQQQIRAKYRQYTDADWDRFGDDEDLIAKVELAKLARIRSGRATLQKAQLLHTKSPDILSEIMTGDGVSHRAKIESAKALGQLAAPPASANPLASSTHFHIVIDLSAGGTDNEILTFNKPIAIGVEPDTDQIPTPWGLITAKKEDGGGHGAI
jgi:hypothetical protein